MSRTIRVLHVIDGLEVGGAQSALLGILELADRASFDMSVANVGSAYDDRLVERLRGAGADLTLMSGRAIWDARALASLVRTIRSRHIDVVHTHLAGGDVLGGIAARLTRRPTVSILQNVVAARDVYRRRRRVLADFATRRLADRVVAVSEAVKQSHVESLAIPPERIEVVANVPVAAFTLAPEFDRAGKRAELGAGDGPLVCVASRLNEQREHETLLRALPSVLARRPDVSVVVLGDGPRRELLEGLARELALGERVRFLGTRFDAVEVMAASDIFSQPTLYEGMPVAVLEAMALGLPVVASAVEGVTELVEDERSGLLVPPRDVPALEQALQRLIEDEDLRAGLGARGREIVRERYGPDTWIQSFERIYRELGASPGSRRLGSQRS